ncbi:beta-amyrin 11-oxidase-like isoform X2 [Abrus precatorius]|uniref:Beta-amyrin 11-oxidase-like isoform X2 n=1 Tax=Abrus precatorius TaxID=3816 RepID=A0A8B8K3H5_ABRPR|nr:beta-amyrin 11-oxidase-like isoform X2 [Abrus precatorius]
MESYWVWTSVATLLTCYIFVNIFLRRLNGWYYDLKLRKKQHPLPLGDMGWPIIGNLLSFIKDFSSGHPDLFIKNLVTKYGRTGIYKTHLLGMPTIIVCVPDLCKRVLTDDMNFKFGYPKATLKLAPSKTLYDVSTAEHRRLRRLVTAPIVGQNSLTMYIERIEEIVIDSLEEMSSMKHPVEILKETENVSLKVILHIFMGSKNDYLVSRIGDLFSDMHNAIFSLFPINLPGFAFHKALKARKKLMKILESIVEERRSTMKKDQKGDKEDLIDILLQIDGENGEKLGDEDIIDLLIGLLFGGRQSTAFGMMWTLKYLAQHPHLFQKAKDEQEEIMKTRQPSQKHLSFKEIKQMNYTSQVIDEMLRHANLAFTSFREATADVNINGYIVPKGWRVLAWVSAIHMDPEYYSNPEEFNPSRWDDYNAKAGTFLPFGAGSRICPGSDLAKLEISIMLHYFLLNYKLELVNPHCPLACLPTIKPADNCLAKVTKISSP